MLKSAFVFLLAALPIEKLRKAKRPRIFVLSGDEPCAENCALLAQELVRELAGRYDVLVLKIGDVNRPRIPKSSYNLLVPPILTGKHFKKLVFFCARVWRPSYVLVLSSAWAEAVEYFEWANVCTVVLVDRAYDKAVDPPKIGQMLRFGSVLIFADREHFNTAAASYLFLPARRPICLIRPKNHENRVGEGWSNYARNIDVLAQECLEWRTQEFSGHSIVAQSDLFDGDLAFGDDAEGHSKEELIGWYLQASRLAAPRARQSSWLLLRRPTAGFHPLIYASEREGFQDDGRDPLVDYICSGYPKGRWSHRVIDLVRAQEGQKSTLRVALHLHLHYTELLPEFLACLAHNKSEADLFISTNSAEKAIFVNEQSSSRAREIRIVPNRGRDIGSFLNAYSFDHWSSYDVVGHFHGKRSLHGIDAQNEGPGDRWRRFIWNHLMGPMTPAMDAILNAFEEDSHLGLVFAEDPILFNCGINEHLAEKLAQRLNLSLPLPTHFDFPVGNMFWARPKALKPLFDLGLTWLDFPDEPIETDGTMLHALERLTPFVASQQGYEYACTYIRGYRR